MADWQLKDALKEDIELLLQKMGSSFAIRFEPMELAHVRYFGELCDHIVAKIQGQNTEDCTLQQAFYKLRSAISEVTGAERKKIIPDSSMAALIPPKNRKDTLSEVEALLGFKIHILQPPGWVTMVLTFILFLSVVGTFIILPIGLGMILLATAGFGIAGKLGNDFSCKTVGEVARKITRTHYRNSRRNPETFSKKEIETVVIDWFGDELGIDKVLLVRTAPLPER